MHGAVSLECYQVHLSCCAPQMHHCKEAIDDLKYSPDGSKLAAGSHDNFIDIFDVHKGWALCHAYDRRALPHVSRSDELFS